MVTTYNQQLKCFEFPSHPNFLPNLSPIEMVRFGLFGGNYFGNSEVNKNWEDYVPQEFINLCKKENLTHLLTSPTYEQSNNKYKVTCGMDYQGWITQNWIHEQDPYGWFNWYINFYYGRRSDDDIRQINRWKSFISRHSGTLRSICLRNNLPITDETVSPKTRQGLLHWAYNPC